MKIRGAKILVEELIKQGITTIYGYPGGTVLDIYDELRAAQDRIQHVLVAHEQGAAHAADGYARASGKTGVCLATSGPGATNLVTGIANAYLDSVPMVIITGNVATHVLGSDSFQEVDIFGITQPIVKHNYIVKDVVDLEPILQEAFFLANDGRKGPVLVDIPNDVQKAITEYPGNRAKELAKKFKTAAEKAGMPDLSEVLRLIKTSRRPFIYAGGGVISAGAEEELLEFSKKINAPIGFSMMGITAVPRSYPLNLGMCGMHGLYASTKAQSECDLEIAVGVRFSNRATGDVRAYTSKCTVIHIDIDNAELHKNIDSDFDIHGDLKAILRRLTEELKPQEHEEWLAEIEQYKELDKHPENDDFDAYNIIQKLHAHMTPDTLVSVDVGLHQMWTLQHYPFEKPRTLLSSGGLGAMGFGFGAIIGGTMAKGNCRGLMITGDGSFGMNMTEMATAVTNRLPITIVVLVNSALGLVKELQTFFQGNRIYQTELDRRTDFAAIARAFGAEGWSAHDLDELEEALQKADRCEGPCLIQCFIDPEALCFPLVPPGGSVKNIIMGRD